MTSASRRSQSSCKPGVFSRRQVLNAGGAGAAAALWGNWLSAASTNQLVEKRRRAKSVIMIFNCGAPSHIDLWEQ